MGQIAEMMLDGTCCEGCGEFIGDAAGYPRYCSKACEPAGYVSGREQELRDRHRSKSMTGSMSPRARKAMRHNQERRADAKTRKPFECKACHKLFKSEHGRDHHFGVKHQS